MLELEELPNLCWGVRRENGFRILYCGGYGIFCIFPQYKMRGDEIKPFRCRITTLNHNIDFCSLAKLDSKFGYRNFQEAEKLLWAWAVQNFERIIKLPVPMRWHISCENIDDLSKELHFVSQINTNCL